MQSEPDSHSLKFPLAENGHYLLYTTTKAEGPVLRGKQLFTGCDF
jgi:hypothetical protein